MSTLILKIRMNSDECVDDKDEIYKAMQALVAHVHIDIENSALIALMAQAVQSNALPVGADYEVVED